ncbi:hypothetical protein D3C72_2203340 [compost metagenome]
MILVAHQAQADVGVSRRQQHGGIGAIVGGRVVGLHRQKYLAQVDHAIGAIQIGNVGKDAVMLPAHDLVTGNPATTIGRVSQPLAGHQPNVA